jgi:hypothetical protein
LVSESDYREGCLFESFFSLSDDKEGASFLRRTFFVSSMPRQPASLRFPPTSPTGKPRRLPLPFAESSMRRRRQSFRSNIGFMENSHKPLCF